MGEPLLPIVAEIDVNAPIERVWEVMVGETTLPQWLGAMDYRRQVGTTFFMQQDPEKKANGIVLERFSAIGEERPIHARGFRVSLLPQQDLPETQRGGARLRRTREHLAINALRLGEPLLRRELLRGAELLVERRGVHAHGNDEQREGKESPAPVHAANYGCTCGKTAHTP